MKPGAVIVDVAIDQGGCFGDIPPHHPRRPRPSWDGMVHYCVANMPGAVARTATYAPQRGDPACILTWPTRAGRTP